MKYEERTEPWLGACGVFSTVLTEAAVRFQSETIIETFPAQGPQFAQNPYLLSPHSTNVGTGDRPVSGGAAATYREVTHGNLQPRRKQSGRQSGP